MNGSKSMHIASSILPLVDLYPSIFLWRRPSASAIYGLVSLFHFPSYHWCTALTALQVLLLLLFMTLLPAKYLVKLAGLAFGAMFWHVIPVLAAIPPAERSR